MEISKLSRLLIDLPTLIAIVLAAILLGLAAALAWRARAANQHSGALDLRDFESLAQRVADARTYPGAPPLAIAEDGVAGMLAAEIEATLVHYSSKIERLEARLEQLDRLKPLTAHNILSPLGIVYDQLDEIQSYDPSDRIAEVIGRVHGAMDKVRRRVERMIKEGQSSHDLFAAVPLSLVVTNTANVYRAKAARKGLALHADIAPQIDILAGNEVEIVIENLIDNAIKYTTQGSITVTLTQDDDTFEFSVADTGPGVPEDALDRLGNYRFTTDTPTSETSHGLGLHQVRELSRRYGFDFEASNLQPGLRVSLRGSILVRRVANAIPPDVPFDLTQSVRGDAIVV